MRPGPPSLPTRIYLTGFMGSGKSTLGPLLAERLGYRFVDLDAEIEARIGTTIRRFFAEQGEPAFRRVEREALVDAARRERVVVALGGGAVASEPNLALVLASGRLVYLYTPVERLVERLRRSGTRPLLRDEHGALLPPERLAARIREMLDAREPFYRRAHLVAEVSDLSVRQAVEALVAGLRESGGAEERKSG